MYSIKFATKTQRLVAALSSIVHDKGSRTSPILTFDTLQHERGLLWVEATSHHGMYGSDRCKTLVGTTLVQNHGTFVA